MRDWLKTTLSAEDRKRVGHDIMTVEFGWPLGMPACRHLRRWRVGGSHETLAESDRAGFVLHRQTRADGPATRIHQEDATNSRRGLESDAWQQGKA